MSDAHEELEKRVAERTAELAEVNRLLKQEVGHRLRAEEANAKFAAIVENSSDAIVAHKLDGTIVTWNKGAERLFGYTEDEARGASIAMLVPPERADELPDNLRAIRQGEAVVNLETQRMRKDGSRIEVSLTISPIKDAAGRVVGASRIARDITQRKEMEQALRDGEARARAILDTAVDGIITIDERGIIESLNRAAERLFGFTADEVKGENVNVLMPEPYKGEHDQYMRNYLQTGKAKIIGIGREVLGQRKDGTAFPIDLAVSEVKLGERRLFTGIVRDLTQQKRLEREILDVSDREKRRIGQDLHDSLGQLLAGIGFKSKSLENKITAKGLPEAENAKQIAALVTQAISQARALARGLQPVDQKASGLQTAIGEMAAGLESLFRVTCKFHCPDPILMEDPGVSTHLYRIAQEAANNAVKHGHASNIDVSLARDATSGTITLSIADNGVGFHQPPAATHKGMGLHTMNYRAAMIGGTLSIRARAEGGTLVTCSVPNVVQKPTQSD